ncbi:SBBP repeat-containing protein [Desulfobacter hydrogenophilus]|uniref:Filamentous hemagglutinin N-terminal domain-containing protein n=1 Tax=Desulfobacter hydrogenophilus TaxID=2291 RepID=A0ABX5RK04_9BACT|nr:SBBP repeat-containing protein [Desulfobacter hydrogenophilus]NDY73861.1 filamentous hemagglutinin N-terminal domain-containing protein [Desulfobacter hydrogenophilus]QBH14744.1 filamentous hemagglutinin N-terminal domain-containing protein [Desulfobacter hydrogenophilus]
MNNLIKNKLSNFTVLNITSLVCFLCLSTTVWANPQGGKVVDGNATITTPTAKQTVIHQSSDKAIINWDQFNIDSGEHTKFVQPSAGSVTLNRVVGNDPSKILGQLSANGKLVLVNPNGVFFGPDSKVDVAAMIATTNDITNDDFMAGRLNFTIPGNPGAQIINQGTMTIQEGGLVALVAPFVQNNGLIQARLGKVVLASANTFTLDLYGDDLILFEADNTITEQLQDAFGNALDSAIEQSGVIEADGGYVLLTTDVAKNVVDNAINMTGIIKAQSVKEQGGTIILNAGEGSATVSGVLDASGQEQTMGGEIRAIAEDQLNVTDGAIITAQGGSDGGDGGFLALAAGNQLTVNGRYSVLAGAPDAENGWLYIGNNTTATSLMRNPNLDGAGVQPDQATVLFEDNLGQTDDSVDFLTRADNAIMYLTAADAVVAMQTGDDTLGSVGLSLSGANEELTAVGENLLQSYSNYYIGNDPDQWVEGAQHFGAVRYENVYDGIDLIYYGNKNGDIEYDLVVSEGADPSKITLNYQGASSVVLNDMGDLVISIDGQTVVQKAPLTYQVTDEAKVIVPSRYNLTDNHVSIRLDEYDNSQVLVVDPVLKWSSFLGGSGSDSYTDIAVDSNYDLIATGHTTSVGMFSYFQGSSSLDTSHNGSTDAFITKYSSDGTVLWGSYYGGSGSDSANGIAIDSNGNIVIVGETQSENLPLLNSLDQVNNGGTDPFAAKFNPNGEMVYSTYLSGTTYYDAGRAVAIDDYDNIFIVSEKDFYGFQYPSNTDKCSIITKLSNSGELLWSRSFSLSQSYTYGSYESPYDIAIDSQGNPIIVGTASVKREYHYYTPYYDYYRYIWDSDAFIAKYSSSGDFVFSTAITGYKKDVLGLGIAVDSQDNSIMTGYAFPNGNWDVLVSKISSSGALVWSKYLAGSGDDRGYDVAVDAQDYIFVTGKTDSSSFYDLYSDGTSYHGGTDAFLAELSPTGGLIFRSYIGGAGADISNSVATDRLGNIYIAGETSSADFNTTPYAGVAFVSKVDLVANIPAELSGSSDLTFYEGDAAISLFSLISITDVDSDYHIASAEISISSGFEPINDLLLFNNQTGITGSYDSATGILTLTGIATIQDYETAIHSIQFSNNSQNPSSTERVITLTVNDIEEDSLPLNSTLSVTPVNDVPIIDNASDVDFQENATGVFLFPDLNLDDVDNTELTGATLKLSSGFFATEDSLVFIDQNNISGTYDSATGILQLSGTASLADYQTAIRSIQYVNTSEAPSSSQRSASIILTDGEDASGQLLSTVTVTPVNDAPALDTSVYGGNTPTGGVRTTTVDVASNTGVLVTDLMAAGGTGFVTDVDSNNIGIAVTNLDAPDGTWQYTLNNGTTWQNFPSVSDSSALLLTADQQTKVRYSPDNMTEGTSIERAIAFFAWDQSYGNNGESGVNVNVRGDDTAYSVDWARGYLSLSKADTSSGEGTGDNGTTDTIGTGSTDVNQIINSSGDEGSRDEPLTPDPYEPFVFDGRTVSGDNLMQFSTLDRIEIAEELEDRAYLLADDIYSAQVPDEISYQLQWMDSLLAPAYLGTSGSFRSSVSMIDGKVFFADDTEPLVIKAFSGVTDDSLAALYEMRDEVFEQNGLNIGFIEIGDTASYSPMDVIVGHMLANKAVSEYDRAATAARAAVSMGLISEEQNNFGYVGLLDTFEQPSFANQMTAISNSFQDTFVELGKAALPEADFKILKYSYGLSENFFNNAIDTKDKLMEVVADPSLLNGTNTVLAYVTTVSDLINDANMLLEGVGNLPSKVTANLSKLTVLGQNIDSAAKRNAGYAILANETSLTNGTRVLASMMKKAALHELITESCNVVANIIEIFAELSGSETMKIASGYLNAASTAIDTVGEYDNQAITSELQYLQRQTAAYQPAIPDNAFKEYETSRTVLDAITTPAL